MDELHELVRGAETQVPLAPRSRTRSTCFPAATPPRSSPSCVRGITWDRVNGVVKGRSGAAAACGHERRNDSRPGALRRVSRRRRRPGGRARRGDGVRGPRQGQTFMLGATTWRIEDITRDRVLVSPAPGIPGVVPFWKGEGTRPPLRARRGDGRAGRELVALNDEKAVTRLSTDHCLDQSRRLEPPYVSARAGGRRRGRFPPTVPSSSSASATRSATGACAS